MTHIIAKHALIYRKDNIKKYDSNKEGIMSEPYSGIVTDTDDPENVTNAKENNLELSFPWTLQEYSNDQHKNHRLPDNIDYQSHHPITNSHVHICLFGHFNENNTSSEIESLTNIGCIFELNGMFNSQVEEQMHLKFDSNKNF